MTYTFGKENIEVKTTKYTFYLLKEAQLLALLSDEVSGKKVTGHHHAGHLVKIFKVLFPILTNIFLLIYVSSFSINNQLLRPSIIFAGMDPHRHKVKFCIPFLFKNLDLFVLDCSKFCKCGPIQMGPVPHNMGLVPNFYFIVEQFNGGNHIFCINFVLFRL